MKKTNTKLKTVKRTKRSFDAAQINRLTASWSTFVNSINDDLKYELKPLRARSNELAQNEPLYKKYLNLVEENIVGANGFQLQSKAADDVGVDTIANNIIESHFHQWSKECDIRGKLSLPEMERMVTRSTARDGEILIRHIFDAQFKYGYKIQLISADRLSDICREADGNGKNKIISGVEINSFGTPLFYHLYKEKTTPGSPTFSVPAFEISHVFVSEYSEQVRGIPWGHAVMTRLHVLKKYVEFALTASAIGASKMGFFTSENEAANPLADDEDNETGELYTSAVGGEFGLLPPGYKFESFNPDYPHAMFDVFTKTVNRWIASGLGVSYNLLCNDLEGVSYSSIRSSVLEERNHWTTLQNTFIYQLMEPIYKNWLNSALLKNALTDSKGKPLPATRMEKFSQHIFLGRRWEWVDPSRDAEAKIKLLTNKLASPYTITAEMGLDLDHILDDLARFESECIKRNLDPSSVLSNIHDVVNQKINDASNQKSEDI